MVRNIRGHRIRWHIMAAQGAYIGVASAAVMLAIAMATFPIFASNTDGWTFAKIISTVALGNSAAHPLTGFAFVPVVVGLAIHFALSITIGVVYAGLVAMFDLEGWTPVALMGLIIGAIAFVWSAALIGAGVGPASFADLPLGALLWGNIAFGLTAGVLLATWADRADLDRDITSVDDGVRVRAFEGDELQTGLPR
ncbi:MAG: hypothetical protein ABI200_01355 [Gaiellales bacterium]